MSKIACLFPGQGSQRAGMGRQLADRFPAAKAVFEEADRTLDFPLSALCFEGPDDELQLTANTQPAILATSIAAFQSLSEAGVRPDLVAGHSLGEYSALVAADALTLGDALRLVRKRGQFMQSAVPVGVGAMAAILGLAPEKVAGACAAAAAGECCAPANYNSPSQTVIAGHKTAVERAVEECKTRGARKATILNVSAPFHSALMKPAQELMSQPLNAASFADLKFPIVNNVDAEMVSDAERSRSALIRQITAPVRWIESVHRLFDEKVDIFIEIGPGKVLIGLVKSIAKDAGREVRLYNVEDPASLNATLAGLQSGD